MNTQKQPLSPDAILPEPLPPQPNKPQNTLFLLVGALTIMILLIVMAAGFYVLGKKSAGGVVSTEAVPTAFPTASDALPTIIPSRQAVTSPSATPTLNPHSKIFSSKTLGIQFLYKSDAYTGGETVGVSEMGNKVYVYANATKPTDGQYVEVFSKDPADSIETAIKKRFLGGYSEKDCWVENIKSGPADLPTYQRATISYPPNPDAEGPWWVNESKCPAGYSKANGISYFLTDSKNPSKLLFFSIGQYGIDSGIEGKAWQDTLTVNSEQ